MRETYGEIVTMLEQNEVFVFGSNLNDGFHGAGAAGYASFGVPGNRWREFEYDKKPKGWKGHWNVKGQAEGLQFGNNGKSYALPTVWKPGYPKSLKASEIIENIKRMYKVAAEHPQWKFLVAGSSENSRTPLNGYSHEELCAMYKEAGPVPANVLFSTSYTKVIFPEE